jgi:hypothetical protein
VHAVGSYVGVVTDVFADKASEYVIGLEVASANAREWFLPWVATTFEEGTATADSPLVFIPSEHLSFYVENGTRLAERAGDGLLVRPDGHFTNRVAAAASSIAHDSAGET